MFSAACSANDTSVDTQVDRIRYYLSVAAERGQVVQFGATPHEDLNQMPEVNDEAAKYADDFINRNGVI